ncbi:hypothetical protein K1719_022915 [Acacia pycnantha]|nr:hypothetical protein K1719_022915 [Acacia pycnantha]
MDSRSPDSNTISVKGTIPVASTSGSPFINFPSPPANDSSCDGKPISLWPGMYHSPVTTALWEAKSKLLVRQLDPPKDVIEIKLNILLLHL